MNRGRKLYQKALEIYQECSSLDYWPSYSINTQTIKVPRYLENV
jgi:hypothetical protein